MDKPKISIIIPVYNTQEYLEQCLNSVVNQILKAIEIICVDNGSSDNSLTYLREFEKKYKNVKVIIHSEGRLGDARNAGLKIAEGEYISFVDSDDFIDENMLAALYDKAKFTQSDIAACNMTTFYQKDDRYQIKYPKAWFQNKGAFKIYQNYQLLHNLTSCNKIFSRNLLNRYEILFPENTFHEDQFFVIKSLLLAEKIVTIPQPYYYYRKQREGAVSQQLDENVFQIFAVYEQIEDFIKEYKLQNLLPLINEVRISRMINFLTQIQRQFRRSFFHRVKSDFRYLTLKKPARILSSTKVRMFRIIRKTSYELFLIYWYLRVFWSHILKIKPLRLSYIKLKKINAR